MTSECPVLEDSFPGHFPNSVQTELHAVTHLYASSSASPTTSDCQDQQMHHYHHVSVVRCALLQRHAAVFESKRGNPSPRKQRGFRLNRLEMKFGTCGRGCELRQIQTGGELPRFLKLIRRTELICWSRKSTRVGTLGKTFTPLNQVFLKEGGKLIFIFNFPSSRAQGMCEGLINNVMELTYQFSDQNN